jgi:hypothetical protein
MIEQAHGIRSRFRDNYFSGVRVHLLRIVSDKFWQFWTHRDLTAEADSLTFVVVFRPSKLAPIVFPDDYSRSRVVTRIPSLDQRSVVYKGCQLGEESGRSRLRKIRRKSK